MISMSMINDADNDADPIVIEKLEVWHTRNLYLKFCMFHFCLSSYPLYSHILVDVFSLLTMILLSMINDADSNADPIAIEKLGV